MAQATTGDPGQRPRSLSQTTSADLVIDTSDAPWMEVAYKELNKDVREVQRYESFKVPLMRSVTENTPKGPSLLNWSAVNKSLVESYDRVAGPFAISETARDNPEIAKYFKGVKTDPAYDKKGRSYDLAPATSRK